MAIEILKRERAKLREKARFYNRKFQDGHVGVRTWNLLRQCAQITTAIVVLKHTGGIA